MTISRLLKDAVLRCYGPLKPMMKFLGLNSFLNQVFMTYIEPSILTIGYFFAKDPLTVSVGGHSSQFHIPNKTQYEHISTFVGEKEFAEMILSDIDTDDSETHLPPVAFLSA